MKRQFDDLKKRAKVYQLRKTFCYVKENVNGRENFFNGFVIKIYEDMIVFFDIVLKKEIPIFLTSLEVLEPSRKEVTLKTAWEIYQNELKGGHDTNEKS